MAAGTPRKITRGDTERTGTSEHALAIKHYAELTIAQVCGRIDGLSVSELQQLRQFEARHANRKGMLRAIDRGIARATRGTD